MEINVYIDDVDGEPPAVVEVDDPHTHVAVRLDLAELNDLGAQVAAALDGRRADFVEA